MSEKENRSALDRLLDVVRHQLTQMSNPKHPAFKLTVERMGFGLDENKIPQVAEFVVKVEHVATIAQVATTGVSQLVLPTNLRNDPLPSNVDIGQSEAPNPTQG
jgi:hypothetical protein